MVLYLIAHCRYFPFVYTKTNITEIFCLFLLIVASLTVIFEFHLENPKAVSAIMSVIVLLPILLLLFLCSLSAWRYYQSKKDVNFVNTAQFKYRVKGMKSKRLTASQLELFKSQHQEIGRESENVAIGMASLQPSIEAYDDSDSENDDANYEAGVSKMRSTQL